MKAFLDPPAEAVPMLEAAREGRLVLQRCAGCGRWQHYPRRACTSCASTNLEWAPASGRGTVHTFTVVHQNRAPGWAEEVPYVVAVVDLAEGVRLTTNVVDCDPADVRVGLPVEVVFRAEGELTLPRVRPA